MNRSRLAGHGNRFGSVTPDVVAREFDVKVVSAAPVMSHSDHLRNCLSRAPMASSFLSRMLFPEAKDDTKTTSTSKCLNGNGFVP